MNIYEVVCRLYALYILSEYILEAITRIESLYPLHLFQNFNQMTLGHDSLLTQKLLV